MCDSEETFYEDERRLKNSGVRNVFTPHTPINQENLFRGRINEVQQILSTLNTPGQHVLLFGERGVGKSSLANIASNKLIKIAGKELVVKRCSKSDSFLLYLKMFYLNVELIFLFQQRIIQVVLHSMGLDIRNVRSVLDLQTRYNLLRGYVIKLKILIFFCSLMSLIL